MHMIIKGFKSGLIRDNTQSNGKPNPKNFCSASLKLHKVYFSGSVLLKCHGNGAGNDEPTPNPAEISQAEAEQTTTVSVHGARTCLQGHRTLYLPAAANCQKAAGWI